MAKRPNHVEMVSLGSAKSSYSHFDGLNVRNYRSWYITSPTKITWSYHVLFACIACKKMFSLMCSKKPKHDNYISWNSLFKQRPSFYGSTCDDQALTFFSAAMNLYHVLWWACGVHAPARSWNRICIDSLNQPIEAKICTWRKPVS